MLRLVPMRLHRSELPELLKQSPASDARDKRGRTLNHPVKSGRLYLVRELRKQDENTVVGQLVVLQLPDNFCLFEDGGLWCAVPPGFNDFDEDPIGWGRTQREAVQNLVGSAEFRTRAAREGWNMNPSAADFTVLDRSAERPYQPDSAESDQ